jgi:hypothetical protein
VERVQIELLSLSHHRSIKGGRMFLQDIKELIPISLKKPFPEFNLSTFSRLCPSAFFSAWKTEMEEII